MSVRPGAVLTELVNLAKRAGVFEVARIGEYRNAPPNGIVFAVWAQEFGAAPTGSGTASTTPLLQATARIYVPTLNKSEEAWELKALDAADSYLTALNGAFTLGGLIRNVDLLGEMGQAPAWKFGHLTIDSKPSRVADLQIYAVLSDEWTQAE